MMARPLAVQLRNLQSLVETGVDKNTTDVFPAPLISTIEELAAFSTREDSASGARTPVTAPGPSRVAGAAAPALTAAAAAGLTTPGSAPKGWP